MISEIDYSELSPRISYPEGAFCHEGRFSAEALLYFFSNQDPIMSRRHTFSQEGICVFLFFTCYSSYICHMKTHESLLSMSFPIGIYCEAVTPPPAYEQVACKAGGMRMRSGGK